MVPLSLSGQSIHLQELVEGEKAEKSHLLSKLLGLERSYNISLKGPLVKTHHIVPPDARDAGNVVPG